MQTKRVPYTFNRGGYYYFSRRVPSDLLHHYSYPRVVQGLRTSSASKAKTRALIAAAKLDEYWCRIRMTDPDLVGAHLLKQSSHITNDESNILSQKMTVSLSEAISIYVAHKGQGKSKTFYAAIERAFRYLVSACGSKDLHEYTRQDALKYRDYLVAKGLSGSSITRVLNTLRPVLNFVISEYALDIKNPFVGLYYERTSGVSKRLPIPLKTIKKIQAECRRYDDDMRWLIALLSDSGMRLSESAGLLKADISLEAAVPHVVIQPHAWRRLKTLASERKVPLVGEALWAARRIFESHHGSKFAFPRYNKASFTNANSASAALNKWLKAFVPQGCTVHSFRHSLRDRLRAVECPSDIIDQIGGWTREGVGEGYGEGHTLGKTYLYMERL